MNARARWQTRHPPARGQGAILIRFRSPSCCPSALTRPGHPPADGQPAPFPQGTPRFARQVREQVHTGPDISGSPVAGSAAVVEARPIPALFCRCSGNTARAAASAACWPARPCEFLCSAALPGFRADRLAPSRAHDCSPARSSRSVLRSDSPHWRVHSVVDALRPRPAPPGDGGFEIDDPRGWLPIMQDGQRVTPHVGWVDVPWDPPGGLLGQMHIGQCGIGMRLIELRLTGMREKSVDAPTKHHVARQKEAQVGHRGRALDGPVAHSQDAGRPIAAMIWINRHLHRSGW